MQQEVVFIKRIKLRTQALRYTKIIHYIHIIFTASLFLLTQIYVYTNNFSFLFQSQKVSNIYGSISYLTIYTSFSVILIDIITDENSFDDKTFLEEIKERIGIKPIKISRIIMGFLLALLLFIIDYSIKITIFDYAFSLKLNNLIINIQNNFGHTFTSLTIGPLIEELIYRGFLLGSFYVILNNDLMFLPLIMSSFIFGYIHPNFPQLKVIGGLELGFIYLWKHNKNFDLVLYSHIFLNLFMLFLHA